MVCADLDELMRSVQQWKGANKKIVFTNGVFDILHLGHVAYLAQAKALGNILVVAVNDDESVRRLNKGTERPINPEHARATLVDALKSVDGVIIFSENTPIDLIKKIQPDILVKGGDYDPSEMNESTKTFIVGSTEVKENGGDVIAIPLVKGFSTTHIVAKLRK